MKSFETLLQNACEDFFNSLDHEPTLEDIANVCNTPIANVVWKAIRNSQQCRNSTESIINGVKQSDAKRFLNLAGQSLLNKPVGSCLGSLKMLFRDAKTYGFNFFYGTSEGLFETLQHSENDSLPIVGYGLEKIKK